MNKTHTILLGAIVLGAAAMLAPAHADDAVLSGTITSAAGEKLGGITVSAKPAGGTRRCRPANIGSGRRR
jgi:hypothetical protein